MIQDKDLQACVAFSGTDQVLSIYLDTDLADKSKDAVRLMFREQTKELPPELPDLKAVQRYLDYEYDWQAPGLAVFSAGQELWRVVPLPIAVRSRAYYGERPYVRVLADLVDRFENYGVALVDQEAVKLYAVAMGRIEPVLEVVGQEVRSYKQGGWSVRGGQRSAVTTHGGTNPAWHNLKHAAEVIQTYCSETKCRRLALGGSAEAVHQLREMLPKGLQDSVIGEFAADMEESPDEILRRSLEVAMRADLKAEKNLVTQALTAAAKGGAGVTGLIDTLSMVHQGRVRTLLVDEDFGAPGNVCGHCGYVSAEPLERCPFCSYQEFVASADVVNLAIHKALQAGADLNVVRDSAELVGAGGIAALLRY